MATRTLVSKQQISGHFRRAQDRLQKAFKGSTREDVIIQAAVGAAGVSIALRLLRIRAISQVLSGFAPMIAFAALYARGQNARTR
jgi:hypothetical protein